MTIDDMTSESFPIRVFPQKDGLVAIAIGENAVQGTWIDALDLAWVITAAASESALALEVPRDIFFNQMTQSALNLTLGSASNHDE